MNVNNKFNHLQINTCAHNYHKIKQIDPDENNEGIIFLICGFCGQEYNESIPILNEENYIIQKLTANCQHGNGKRYISKKNMNISYEKQII
jgi:transcription elongation factor Elf1